MLILFKLSITFQLVQVEEERSRINEALTEAKVSAEEHNQDLRLLEDQYEHLKDTHVST